MALHVRQQIVDEVVATLKAADTAAGAKVYPSRRIPPRPADLPAIYVYAHVEDVPENRPQAGPPYNYDRALVLLTHLLVKGDDGEALEENLNALALEVETALHADLTRAGLADETFYAGTEMDLHGDASPPVAQAAVKWTILYLA